MENEATLPDRLNAREREILGRLAAGLTDQQIADGLFLSLNTVKWYNRQIYSKLGVGSRTQAIALARRLHLLDGTLPIAQPVLAGRNLPAAGTPFIGRSREIAEVIQLLRASRLLTLTGAGGTGKTRLALQAADAVSADYAEGVYFVDLAPLADQSLVANAIAAALGVFANPTEPLPDTLKRALTQRELLLLIDNFEHVIQAAPLLSTLLAASSHLKILATSRESLRLAGEQEYPVPPLSLIATNAATGQDLVESEAAALFVQRARMACPRLTLSDDNASAIALICQRLDGLPLAIELAAARCKLLTPRALLERLEGAHGDSPLDVLTGAARDATPRHRTLRDTMTWSYNLLNEDEKTLFARLAVFRGGRSLDAVEAVCGEGLGGDVFDVLASLLDKSLVQQQEVPGGEARFALLETIHEYARERLEAGGETERVRTRHATYSVALAERAEPELRLSRYDYWCERMVLDLENMRAALEWSLGTGDVTLGVRLAGALGLFWYGKGYHVEGINWMQRLLPRLDETPATNHSRFLISAGHMAWLYDLELAQRLFDRALVVSRDLGDTLQVAWALCFLGYARMHDPETALPVAEEGMALFRDLNHLPGIAQALNIIGEIHRLSGDDQGAKRAYEECLVISQQTGEARRVCYMCNNLAYVAQHEGDHERAAALARRGLRLARDRKDKRDMAETLVTLAGSISAQGEPSSAARLLAAAQIALERMGSIGQPSDLQESERILTSIHAQLAANAFEAAWMEGSGMTLETAVADALA